MLLITGSTLSARLMAASVSSSADTSRFRIRWASAVASSLPKASSVKACTRGGVNDADIDWTPGEALWCFFYSMRAQHSTKSSSGLTCHFRYFLAAFTSLLDNVVSTADFLSPLFGHFSHTFR